MIEIMNCFIMLNTYSCICKDNENLKKTPHLILKKQAALTRGLPKKYMKAVI